MWNLNQSLRLGCLALVMIACGCQRRGPQQPSPDAIPDDRYAVAELPVKYLAQNWTPKQSLEFYALRQGSPIMRKDFFDALEQPDNQALFRDTDYLATFGFLPQQSHARNPAGYPVGFVADSAIEINCSACHTSRLTFAGTEYRIDGGQAITDVESWLDALVTSLAQTVQGAPSLDDLRARDPVETISLDPSTKFGRFAKRILGQDTVRVSQLYPVVFLLNRDYERRQRYNDYNDFGEALAPDADRDRPKEHPPYGFARLDALGAILNQACAESLRISGFEDVADQNANAADAPVNYPAIWDAPQHTNVQWNGAVDNQAFLGPLGRNSGQVIGVFGIVEIDGDAWIGYDSSIRFSALKRAEAMITTLWSPLWPDAFGIDRTLVDQGRAVYEQNCVECHSLMKRDDPRRRANDILVPIAKPWKNYPTLATDDRTAKNFSTRDALAGPLAGRPMLQPFGTKFPSDDRRVWSKDILTHLVGRTVVRSFVPWRDELTLDEDDRPLDVEVTALAEPVLNYKSRPLNGVWSTAPYLHNGSVLNMVELLKPPAERLASFQTGTVEYDPATLGFQNAGPTVLDTSLDGNHNGGHLYGTDLPSEDKSALLEFLKTL